MKKRNLVIVAFMLVAAMTIGVGYAALSATLTIKGTANLDLSAASGDVTKQVYITSGSSAKTHTHATLKDYANTGEETFTEKEYSSVNFEVYSLTQVGQSVTFTYTIKNAGDASVVATVSLPNETVSDKSYFTANIKWADPSVTGTSVVLQSGQTADVSVIVELDTIPASTTETMLHDSFEFSVTAELATNTQ